MDPSDQPQQATSTRSKASSPFQPERWKGLLKLVAMILLAQLIFWGMFYVPWGPKPSFSKIDRIEFTSAQLSELDAPTPQAADAAAYTKINLPYTDCCDPAYLSLKLNFDVKDPSSEGLGLVAFQQVDNFIYRVNGSIIHQKGRMEIGSQTFHGQRPYLLHIPQGLLREGTNEINIITVREGHPYTDLIEPLMGPYRQVHEITALRFWQTVDYRLLGGGLTATLGLLAFIMLFRSQEKRFALWLAVLCWAWTVYAAYGLYFDLPISGTGRLILFFGVTALVNIGLLCFIDAWTRHPLPYVQQAMVLIWVAYTAIATYAMLYMPAPNGHDLMDTLWTWFAFGTGLLVILRLLWHFGTQAENRTTEAAILSICAVCLALDGIGNKFGLLSGAYLLESAPLLLLAMVIAFIQRNFHLFQSALTLNRLLESNLQKREAELAEAHQRERQMSAIQARNEERRRLMQDMHDGVGGQLVGLLLAVRRGTADNGRLIEGLQAAMDEIRLMIDSVDSSVSSLETMLAVFQARIRPRVEEAGFTFEWQEQLTRPADLSPAEVLQIFRILQESVTNALKHSGGNTITISVTEACDGTLKLCVSDNGTLNTPATGSLGKVVGQGGHGLENMRNRARSIGSKLDWDQSASGTTVTLHVPVQTGLTQAA